MEMSRKTDASSPSGGLWFATGTYTGNGAATQAIVGVGFQPRFVLMYGQSDPGGLIVEGDKTDRDGVNASWWDPAIPGWRYEADAIISLDADGFTVGDGTPFGANKFNILNVVYSFMCWG